MEMTERERLALLRIHILLFVLQIATAGAAIGLHAGWAALAPIIGGAQAWFPKPFKVL
jgi:hypothetical protein